MELYPLHETIANFAIELLAAPHVHVSDIHGTSKRVSRSDFLVLGRKKILCRGQPPRFELNQKSLQ